MEVKYIPPNDGGGALIPKGGRRKCGLSMILTVLTLAFSVVAFTLLFVWFYSLPKNVQTQNEEILRLNQLVQHQQEEIEDLKSSARSRVHQLEYQSEVESRDNSTLCDQRQDAGPCLAAVPRWFFQKDSNSCQQFV